MESGSKAIKATINRSSGRMTALWVAVLFAFMMELLFYTWCRVQCVQAGYAIDRETRKQEELRILQNSLRIELTRLKAPEMISRIARERLTLVIPEPQQIIVVP